MTIPELKAKISEIDNQISDLKGKRLALMVELKDAIQASFEAEHGVKVGDPIVTRMGTKMFYGGFILNSYGNVICLCHPCKNDGTAGKAVRHLCSADF